MVVSFYRVLEWCLFFRISNLSSTTLYNHHGCLRLLGCGAIWEPSWLQLQWVGPLKDAFIATKELVPVVLAVAIWGRHWSKKSIRVLSDNFTVVAAINNNTSRVPDMAHLLRCLAFYKLIGNVRSQPSMSLGFITPQQTQYRTISCLSSFLYVRRHAPAQW